MDNSEMAKLFFPGARTENIVQGISLLQTKEGEKRIKLEMAMDFSSGKVMGMSSYLAEPYESIARAESIEKFTKLNLDFEAMTMRVYTYDDQDEAAQVLYNVIMGSFSFAKGSDEAEDVAGVVLKYVAKVPSNPKLWAWLHDYHRGTLFIRFEPTQSDISDVVAAPPENQLTFDDAGGDDDYEAQRKDATSPARDAEFAADGDNHARNTPLITMSKGRRKPATEPQPVN